MSSELPTVSFFGADEALAWAEEQTSRPDIVSPTQMLINALTRVPGRGSSEWTPQDFRDLAETILGAWATIPDANARNALRHVAGQYSDPRKEALDAALWSYLQSQPEMIAGKEGQLRRIVPVVTLRARAKHNDKPAPKSLYAREIGVEPPALYTPQWRQILYWAEWYVWDRFASGKRALAVILDERGIKGVGVR